MARERFAELVYVLLDDALATGIPAFTQFLEQAPGRGEALAPPLVQVGLVGIEDARAACPLLDEQFIRTRRVGESANGVAGQAQLPGDGPQPETLVELVQLPGTGTGLG